MASMHAYTAARKTTTAARGHRWRMSFLRIRRASRMVASLGRVPAGFGQGDEDRAQRHAVGGHVAEIREQAASLCGGLLRVEAGLHEANHGARGLRSEERRGGKECRSRG